MPSSTSSSEARPRGRRVPAAFLLGVLLFAATDHLLWSNRDLLRFVGRYMPPGPNGDPLLSTLGVLELPRTGPPPVLLLGSSQVREGLDCAPFERRLPGRPCRNLGISAGSPLDVLYLSRQIDRRAPRHVAVLGLFPKVLHGRLKEPFVDGSTVGCLLSRGNWRRLSGSDRMEVAFGLLQGLSPTLRFKDGLWDFYGVVRPDLGAAWSFRLPPQPKRLLAQQPPQPPEYFALRLNKVDPEGVRPSLAGAHEEALERLLAHERQRGNRVIVIDFPTRPGYESTLLPETLENHRRIMAGLARRSDLSLVSAPDLPALTTGDFLDFTHLSRTGRSKVSDRLAEIVARLEGS
ncbi:MAG TPA: hypothetical protein VJU18_07650 [Vicinamibacteria bacterium]|nr:hypothetical protein [Vicinamibacteria bacterium]